MVLGVGGAFEVACSAAPIFLLAQLGGFLALPVPAGAGVREAILVLGLEPSLGAPAALADPRVDPGAQAEQTDDLERMRAAVARLPTRQRQVVELRLAEGLGHAEIAAALGIREDNARANLYQALRKLRAELDES